MTEQACLSVSIVILTFNRPEELLKTVLSLGEQVIERFEVIVVDNASNQPASEVLKEYPDILCLRMAQNIGVGARNRGIEAAKGDVVVTLDDDVRDISLADLAYLSTLFARDDALAAINFKVLEEGSEKQINWCHHRKVEDWGDCSFETYEISEGAVALRRNMVIDVGMYPEKYFISHEGPDLALRLMNAGKIVRYDPAIIVHHAQSEVARVSWRRYYYDSRNLIWFVYKYFGWKRGAPKITIQLGAMLFYSLRDGYLKYWFRAVRDALSGLSEVKRDSQPISSEAWERYDKLKTYNPSIIYLVKRRIFKRDVSI